MASTTQVSPFQKSASILRKPTGFMKRPCWENSGTQPTAADEFSSTAGAVLAPLSRAFQHPSFYYVNYLVYFSTKNYLVTHRSGIITVFVCFRPRFPPPLPLPFLCWGPPVCSTEHSIPFYIHHESGAKLGVRIPERNSPALTACLLVSPLPIPSQEIQNFIVPFKLVLASLPLKLQRNQRLLLFPYHTRLPSVWPAPMPPPTEPTCLPAIGQVLVPPFLPSCSMSFSCYKHMQISSFPHANKPHHPLYSSILSLASKSSFDLHSQVSGLCFLTSCLHLKPLQPGFHSSELTHNHENLRT